MALTLCVLAKLLTQRHAGEGSGDIATARTAGFSVLVMAHLVQGFNARSDNTSAFNKLLVNLVYSELRKWMMTLAFAALAHRRDAALTR